MSSVESAEGCSGGVHMQNHIASPIGPVPRQYGKEGEGDRCEVCIEDEQQERRATGVPNRLRLLESKVSKSSLWGDQVCGARSRRALYSL